MNEAVINSEDGLEFLNAFEESTRKTYRSALVKFLLFYKQASYGDSLADFLDRIEEDSKKPRRQRSRIARNVLREFVNWLNDKDYAPKTVRTYISSVQSLCSYYGITISTKYANLPSSHPISKKHPWTLEEVGNFINSMRNTELRAIASMIFQSGIGLGDIISISYGDLKREYENDIRPLCFDFSRKKTDVLFMTFIGNWAIDALKDYLGNRPRLGESDTLFSLSERTIEWKFAKLARQQIGEYKGSNPMRPHSLRSAFRTILGDAGLNETYIEFFMGHRLPEQRKVYISKSREGWREIYRRYEDVLTP